MPKKLILDDAALREAVMSSVSYWMVAKKLRPHKPGGIYKSAQRRIRELGLDTSHFTGHAPLPTRWTEAELVGAVATHQRLAGHP